MRRIDFRRDDGVVAIIVALLFSSLVIVGVLAIVIDGGSLYRERRVLQNSSDSAALANAQECALETSRCSSTVFATSYTNANSPDSLSNVKELCGKSTGVITISLNSCAPIQTKPFACKDIQSTYPRFVRVVSDTLTPSGSSIELPFGSALDSAFSSGKKVEACAQVAWGAASSAPVAFPIAFPACGFNRTLNYDIWKPIFSSDTTACTITDIFGANFSYTRNLNGFTQIANGGCPAEFNGRTYKIGDVITTESSFTQLASNPQLVNAVSYTHLTLPTKLL
jgi:Flp pilus assembly protein TadG